MRSFGLKRILLIFSEGFVSNYYASNMRIKKVLKEMYGGRAKRVLMKKDSERENIWKQAAKNNTRCTPCVS